MTKPKRTKRPQVHYDPERAACILAEASLEGDVVVAERWGCSVRTVENYRARLKRDAGLVATFERKKRSLEIPWRERAERTLRLGLERLEQLMAKADVDQLRDVAGAFHIVASHAVTVDALGHGRHLPATQPSPADAPPPSASDRGGLAAAPLH